MTSTAATPGPSVADRLRAHRGRCTPSELRVAQSLLADYPAAGLESVTALGRAASVSAPTVLRLVAKLGFAGYGDFQQALRSELSARSAGPVQSYPRPPGSGSPDEPQAPTTLLSRCAGSISSSVHATLADLDPVDFARTVALLADPARRVLLAGGRFSWLLAEQLGGLLALLRPGVTTPGAPASAGSAALLDVAEGHVVVVYDYRRYERASIHFGEQAVRRGAELVLVTDRWLSPLSRSADVLLTTSAVGPTPFVAFSPAVAVNEALLTGVVEALGESPIPRLADHDELTGSAVESGAGQDARSVASEPARPAAGPRRPPARPGSAA